MRQHLFEHVNVPPQSIYIPNGSPGVDTNAEAERYEEAIEKAGRNRFVSRGNRLEWPHCVQRARSRLPFARLESWILAAETIANAQRQFGAEHGAATSRSQWASPPCSRRDELCCRWPPALLKAGVVERALRGPATESLPASALQRHSDVIAILDEAASGAENQLTAIPHVFVRSIQRGIIVEVLQVTEWKRDFLYACRLASHDAHRRRRKGLQPVIFAKQVFKLCDRFHPHQLAGS